MNYGFCEEKENHYKLQVFFINFGMQFITCFKKLINVGITWGLALCSKNNNIGMF